MATLRQLPSGRWQVQIRLKGRKASLSLLRLHALTLWMAALVAAMATPDRAVKIAIQQRSDAVSGT